MNKQAFDLIWSKLHLIYQVGDRDEMSWKHLGHGIAAVLAFNDWTQTEDYGYPSSYDLWQDAEAHNYLHQQWTVIQGAILSWGKQEFIDAIPSFRTHPYLMYVGNYINEDWLSYKEAIIKQGLELKED